MKKANLNCPRERVFFNDLLVSQPALPRRELQGQQIEMSIEVDILEEQGEQALVLLPNLIAANGQQTALVHVQYLS
ncbi:MAG: hypothetical protein PF542_02695 [Nanoarchaeota archaeon]|jgi:hypothetical protein|nr:hypothetical protein [Nanoarchaeota archaeon]